MEREIYKATVNGTEVFGLQEKGNTISLMFLSLEALEKKANGENVEPFAVAVNDEVISLGKSLGWMKGREVLKEI